MLTNAELVIIILFVYLLYNRISSPQDSAAVQ